MPVRRVKGFLTRLLPSGMLSRVVWYKLTGRPDDVGSKFLRNFGQTTRLDIREGSLLHIRCREPLEAQVSLA